MAGVSTPWQIWGISKAQGLVRVPPPMATTAEALPCRSLRSAVCSLTCPANARTAVDHNGWLRALASGARAHAADGQALLASDHSQEVDEGSC